MGAGRNAQLPFQKAMNTQPINISRGELEAAAIACDFAANATTAEEEMQAMTQILRHQRAIQLTLAAQDLSRYGGPPPDHERLPIRDDGDDIGFVVARIPEKLYWGLYFQKDFGPEGFTSDEGLRDITKHFPVCRTKTISGKTSTGWRANSAASRQGRPASVRFAPGVIELAS
jgi:hypothetical protein